MGFQQDPRPPSGPCRATESAASFSAPRLPIQAKLKVGAVDDPLEHEADRVADQVIRMPDPGGRGDPGEVAAAEPQMR